MEGCENHVYIESGIGEMQSRTVVSISSVILILAPASEWSSFMSSKEDRLTMNIVGFVRGDVQMSTYLIDSPPFAWLWIE